jgi:hypothetical protein
MLLELGRQRPDLLIGLMGQLDHRAEARTPVVEVVQVQVPAPERAGGAAQAGAGLFGATGVSPADRRLRTLVLSMKQLGQLLAGTALSWITQLPEHFQVVRAEVRRREGWLCAILTIHSEELTPFEEGRGIPEWKPENCYGWKK